jgi:tetratricopeptide (TPR) repeat protein
VRTALVILLLVALAPTPALAQDQSDDEVPDSEMVERARSHFNAGIQYYGDSRFEEAAQEFSEAYRLTGHPDVLYNLAQSHDRLEHYEEAIESYRRYLDEADADSSERQRVERRVRELETLLAARAAGEDETEGNAVVVAAPAAPESGGLGALPWITMGVGAASIIAAVAFGVTASGIHSDLEARCDAGGSCAGYDPTDDASRGSTFATLADVFGVVGGVILGTGIVLLAIDLSRDSGEAETSQADASLELTTGPTPLGAGARVRF